MTDGQPSNMLFSTTCLGQKLLLLSLPLPIFFPKTVLRGYGKNSHRRREIKQVTFLSKACLQFRWQLLIITSAQVAFLYSQVEEWGVSELKTVTLTFSISYEMSDQIKQRSRLPLQSWSLLIYLEPFTPSQLNIPSQVYYKATREASWTFCTTELPKARVISNATQQTYTVVKDR